VVAARQNEADALPGLLRFVAIPLAGLLLFLFFLHQGFPYDRLAGAVAARAARATGSEIRMTGTTPRFSLAGPGLETTGATVVTQSGARIEIERLLVRPAWSFAWLRLNPAVYVDATGTFGAAQGVVTLRVPGFHGTLRGIELANLPLATALPGMLLRGQADLDVDLELGDAGPEGTSRFTAARGMLGFDSMPMQVPFTSFSGDLRFGDDQLAALSGASLEGPMISATGSGTLGHAERALDAPLALDLAITASAGMRPHLQAAGIQLGKDGKGKLQVTGTPAQPMLR
jgi:type II secretion system protein N